MSYPFNLGIKQNYSWHAIGTNSSIISSKRVAGDALLLQL